MLVDAIMSTTKGKKQRVANMGLIDQDKSSECFNLSSNGPKTTR